MAILARINHQIALGVCRLKEKFTKGEVVTISKYLDARLISFLRDTDRDTAILHLVDLLDSSGRLQNRGAFYKAILEREKVVSTGIGLGVAIPHAKLKNYSDFFIAIGIQRHGGIEWNALDGNPVRLVFLIGGPENKQTEYLKILSHLTAAIKNEPLRKQLLQSSSSEEVLALFQSL